MESARETECFFIAKGEKMKTVNVLGEEYKILVDEFNTLELKGKNRSGYCAFYAKEIHIANLDTDPDCKDESEKVKERLKKEILRHEILHAFLRESGLQQNTAETYAWAENEEMIDWFAVQYPKIQNAFKEAGAI